MINTILFAFFLSCENKSEIKNTTNTVSTYKSIYRDSEQIDKLKKAIKKEGDTLAFKELQEIFFNSGNKNEFLYYSMFMANNYNNKEAFFSNYMILMTDIINEKNKMNNFYANYYLLKSYELGYKHSVNSIKARFGDKSKLPSSNEYWNLYIGTIEK